MGRKDSLGSCLGLADMARVRSSVSTPQTNTNSHVILHGVWGRVA